jgi:hypothetical protein
MQSWGKDIRRTKMPVMMKALMLLGWVKKKDHWQNLNISLSD